MSAPAFAYGPTRPSSSVARVRNWYLLPGVRKRTSVLAVGDGSATLMKLPPAGRLRSVQRYRSAGDFRCPSVADHIVALDRVGRAEGRVVPTDHQHLAVVQEHRGVVHALVIHRVGV